MATKRLRAGRRCGRVGGMIPNLGEVANELNRIDEFTPEQRAEMFDALRETALHCQRISSLLSDNTALRKALAAKIAHR